MAGLDPWPFTIRELDFAAESKLRAEWDQTAEILAINANLHGGGRYSRDDFHPLREKKPKKSSDPSKIYRELMAKENVRSIQHNSGC